jgi:addiction module HigA family antidote
VRGRHAEAGAGASRGSDVPTDATGPPHPGRVLERDHLQPRRITQKDLPARIGVTPQTMNRFVRGHVRLSREMTGKLAAALGTTVAYWMQLQVDYDVAQCERETGR